MAMKIWKYLNEMCSTVCEVCLEKRSENKKWFDNRDGYRCKL